VTEQSVPVLVLTDPIEIVEALCDADEWDLARKIARKNDAERNRI
jgi:hypothetical protein